MAIKVQGETYADEAEVVDTIGKLTAEAFAMPAGKERAELAAHIDRLNAAIEPDALTVAESGDGSDNGGERLAAPSSEPSPALLEETDVALLEPGMSYLCPMCRGEGELAFEPPEDPNWEKCEACDGWGRTSTGSLVPGYQVSQCSVCGGEGRRPTGEIAAPVANKVATAADVPEALGAVWDAEHSYWMPPPETQPPWPGATWDTYHGKWA